MRNAISTTLLLTLIFIFGVMFTNCETKAQEIEYREVSTNLEVIWEMRWGADNYIWLTERPGRVQRVNPVTGEKSELLDITDEVQSDPFSERGLLGMAFSPTFAEDGYVFLAYNYDGPNGSTVKIVRYTYENNKLDAPIIILDNIKGASNHDGCRLEFGGDGKLYITTGDATNTDLAQSLMSVNGKVLRINPDGTIPEDNPYYGIKSRSNEIWSFGHRNPQGLVFHNSILYSSEHGPSSNDELNIIEKERNYGWPTVEGFCNKPSEMAFCEENNVREPIAIFGEDYTLAVAGIDFYDVPSTAENKINEWQNSILMTTLKTGILMQIKLSEDGKKVLSQKNIIENKYGRLRSICISPDGRVFIGTSNRDGRGNIRENDDKIIELKIKNPESGINNDDKGDLYEIYPNPSNKVFNFKSNNNYVSIVSIYDILGNKLRQFETAPYTTKSIELDGINSGQYNVKIMSNGFITNKIINIIN